jgi:hypothetical protein
LGPALWAFAYHGQVPYSNRHGKRGEILEDDDATPKGDSNDEEEVEHASKKRKRGDPQGKGKGKKKARAESSRPTTIWRRFDENLIYRSDIYDEAYNWLGPAIRQSSVATAGRSVIAESVFFHGEFSL